MGGSHQPFIYSAVHSHSNPSSSSFPEKSFDPKAFTRASWEPKPKPVKHDGPLITFNRHPDSHMVLSHRSNEYASMGPRTRRIIKWTRRLQLLLRILQLNGAIGAMVLIILMTKVSPAEAWVLRIAPGFFIIHCVYAIYHLARPASGRTPGSSAAYQLFATFADLVVLGLYAFGAYTVHQQGSEWGTSLSNADLLDDLVPALYYLYIGAGGAHFITLSMSGYLGVMFRKITLLPPDMNPLEDNLTARPKRVSNRSSATTLANSERLSTPLEQRRRSGLPYESVTRGPTVPFMHTRTQSRDSLDLPHRQYQVLPYNRTSPTASAYSHRTAQRTSYTELPRKSNRGPRATPEKSQVYHALSQPYNLDDMEPDDFDTVAIHDENAPTNMHPDPLRQHPTDLGGKQSTPKRAQTPYRPWANNSLTEISTNARRVGGRAPLETSYSAVTDDLPSSSSSPSGSPTHASPPRASPLHRFFQPKLPASPGRGQLSLADYEGLPLPKVIGGDRKVSSGNDWNESKNQMMKQSGGMRRNVSGKVAEEGRGGF